jgi:hypothetical protein
MTVRACIERLVCCCVAGIALSATAAACSIAGPIEDHIEPAAALVRRFWAASLLLGAGIACVDAYKRQLSASLLTAAVLLVLVGWLLHRSPHWGFFAPDCSYPLLQATQLLSGLMLVLLGVRVLRVLRSG